MKPKTRDNLIYLAVGLGIAALVWINFFRAESRGQEPWWPSRFAFRAVTTSCLLAYFVVKEMRREKATILQMFASVVFATLLELGILFGFRQIVDRLPGIPFTGFAVLEMFFVWQLSVKGVLYLARPGRMGGP